MVSRAGWIALAAAAAGAALFAWTIARVGSEDVIQAARRLGWGFLLIVAIGGLRFVVRSIAWRRCVVPPHRLPFRDALGAFLAGDAVATAVPVGLLASESTKGLFASRRLPTTAAVSSLAIENLLYSLSTGLMVAAGISAFLYAVEAGPRVRGAGTVAIFVFAASAFALLALARTRRRPIAFLAARIGRRLESSGRRPASTDRLGRLSSAAVAIENSVLGFASRGSAFTWIGVFGLEVAYHVLAVLEVWLTLVWILPAAAPSLLQAFVLESANRVINVVFKFVPLRVGIDEMGSGMAAEALALGPVAGVTLAIVRKGRTLCWAAVGFIVLLAAGRQDFAMLWRRRPNG